MGEIDTLIRIYHFKCAVHEAQRFFDANSEDVAFLQAADACSKALDIMDQEIKKIQGGK